MKHILHASLCMSKIVQCNNILQYFFFTQLFSVIQKKTSWFVYASAADYLSLLSIFFIFSQCIPPIFCMFCDWYAWCVTNASSKVITNQIQTIIFASTYTRIYFCDWHKCIQSKGSEYIDWLLNHCQYTQICKLWFLGITRYVS